MAVTMGKIMIASTTAATNTDPLGSMFSLNSGIQPTLLATHSAAGARKGPRTISPHRPKMIDGTAASRSTTKETGPDARLWRYWVRQSATPTAIGTAMAIASTEDKTVVQNIPAMPKARSAPLTVQLREVRKLSWLACRLGSASASKKMPTKSTSKTMAKPAVVASARNTRSPVWLILASLTPRGALLTWSIGGRVGAWR